MKNNDSSPRWKNGRKRTSPPSKPPKQPSLSSPLPSASSLPPSRPSYSTVSPSSTSQPLQCSVQFATPALTSETTALAGVGLLARAKDGLGSKWVKAVVMPRLLWMAGVWYYGKGVSKGLLTIQRAAAHLITGGYWTRLLDALEVEANLVPLKLRLRRAQSRFLLWLHACTSALPLHHRFQLARASRTRFHPSPLHLLLRRWRPSSRSLYLPGTRPWPFESKLPSLKEEGVMTHQVAVEKRQKCSVFAYSNGSPSDGCVGAGVLVEVMDEGGEVGETGQLQSLGDNQKAWAGRLRAPLSLTADFLSS